MQESTRSGLWFSPDYVPELTPDPRPAIQLPPSQPRFSEPSDALAGASLKKTESLNILIWSNSEQEATNIQQVLQSTGFSNVWYATTYDQGLEQMKLVHFDFFIIDLSINGVGLKLVQALRASQTYRETPMLICTESQMIQDMLNAMQAGANDLICKPINGGLLTKKIVLHSQVAKAA